MTSSTPSDASVWMWMSARPRRDRAPRLLVPRASADDRRRPASPRPAASRATRSAGARSGQIGKKTAHHWSGASATASSMARAVDARTDVARCAEASLGRDGDLAHPRDGTGPAPIRHIATKKTRAPASIARSAGPDGQRRRVPEQRDLRPAPRDVAVRDDERRAARVERPAELAPRVLAGPTSRTPTLDRDRANQRCSSGSSTASITPTGRPRPIRAPRRTPAARSGRSARR